MKKPKNYLDQFFEHLQKLFLHDAFHFNAINRKENTNNFIISDYNKIENIVNPELITCPVSTVSLNISVNRKYDIFSSTKRTKYISRSEKKIYFQIFESSYAFTRLKTTVFICGHSKSFIRTNVLTKSNS